MTEQPRPLGLSHAAGTLALAGDQHSPPEQNATGRNTVNLRFIDWIWTIRGSVPVPSGLSEGEAFERLDPLFQQSGTTYERSHDALTFQKKDQAAQDKMSIFDAGALLIQQGVSGQVLQYRLASRALLFCFLAPFLFLAFGQLIVGVGMLEAQETEAAGKEKAKEEKKKDVVLTLNPIDKALGAPAPEKPKKDDKDKSEGDDKKHSPTAAYVFAAIFAALYIVGRILEDRLIKSLFKKRLHGA